MEIEQVAGEGKPDTLLAAASYIFMPYCALAPLITRNRYARFHATRASIFFVFEFFFLAFFLNSLFSGLLLSFSELIRTGDSTASFTGMISSFASLFPPILLFGIINIALAVLAAREQTVTIPIVDWIANELTCKPLIFVMAFVLAVLAVAISFILALLPSLEALKTTITVPSEAISSCQQGVQISAGVANDPAAKLLLVIDGMEGEYCAFSIVRADSGSGLGFTERVWFNSNGELCKYYSTGGGTKIEFNIC